MMMTNLAPRDLPAQENSCQMLFAEKVVAINVAKDVLGELKGLFGGVREEYTKEFTKARELVVEELQEQARQLGAKCIAGLVISLSPLVKQDAVFIAASAYGSAILA